ncbi:MAG: hypothetical protein LBK82_13530 [Planctomycetaceae bacterium]|jgi:hypothetical protein|nr:hypothetical protein [Planctomycetaceae bacterium]
MFRIIFVSLYILLFYQSGCSEKPSGFPNVYPCQIIVHNGEQPEKDVRIILYPSFASGSLLIQGQTDIAGSATISTSLNRFSRQGVPKGKYTAVFEKIPETESSLSKKEIETMKPVQREAYYKEQTKKRLELQKKALPVVLQKPAASPIKFEVKDEIGIVVNVNLKDY